MDQGKRYQITITHTFEGVFSHFEDKDGVKYACFETSGKLYRRVPLDEITRRFEVTKK